MLLPGLLMSATNWHERGYVDHFASRRCVLAIDPLGHGASDKPHDTEAYTLERLAEHTTAVLDAEGFEQADLWGYSRGALLLAAMMQHRPERVRTAIAGGIDLTALAPAPDAGSVTGKRPSAFLRDGDWDGYWKTFPFTVPDDMKLRAEREADPLAIAALMDAEYTLAFDPTQFPGLVYVGDGEPFAERTVEIAGLLGLPCEVLPTGDHVQTSQAAHVVCPLVEKVLDEHSPC